MAGRPPRRQPPAPAGAVAGCEGERPDLTALRLSNFRELWRRRQVEGIYRLGARAVYELFAELIRHNLVDEATLDARLVKFAAADPAKLAVAGGDQMPATPVHFAVARL